MKTDRKISLKELAELVGGTVSSDSATVISGVCSIDKPQPGCITFDDGHGAEFESGSVHPAAIVVKKPDEKIGIAQLVHDNPRLAFINIVNHFHPEPEIKGGIHEKALVDPSASVDPSAWVGPYAVIDKGAKIDARAWVGPCVYVGMNSVIGEKTRLMPNSTVMHDVTIGARCIINPGVVVGGEGFGFTPTRNGNVKVPQVGRVEIGDDVEIGANTTIDRATLDVTRIEDDVKLDNLVQIAHNCRIGAHSRIAAQVGLSGRVNMEENVVVAGQAGFQNGITVGAGSVVGGRAGVTRHVPPGSRISGYPARDHKKALRLLAAQDRLPEILERLERLEKKAGLEVSESK